MGELLQTLKSGTALLLALIIANLNINLQDMRVVNDQHLCIFSLVSVQYLLDILFISVAFLLQKANTLLAFNDNNSIWSISNVSALIVILI